MNKKFPLYVLIGLLMVALMGSCAKDNNKKTNDNTIANVVSYSSTLISSFSIGNNNKLLYNLDSVHFSIDQERCLIYNADSLPVGTKVTHLTVKIAFPTAVSKAEFHVKGGKVMKDTTFAYTSATADSIDFSGKVTLAVTSYDKTSTRTYNINVNVHNMVPDTLTWDPAMRRDLPGVTGTVKEEKMVQQGNNYILLMRDNSSYVLSTANNLGERTWSKKELNLAFTPVVQSLTASADALYVLDNNGELYRSTNQGTTWDDCGVTWHSIVGGYNSKVLGVVKNGSTYQHDEYPRSSGYATIAVPDSFPVSSTSPMVGAHNEWVTAQQALIVGGITASGKATHSAWGYDGKRWGILTDNHTARNNLPALIAPVIVPYYTFSVDTVRHTATKQVTWLVMGGRLANGTPNKKTYVSYDQGISWSLGAKTLQQPQHMPGFYGAQAFVVGETLTRSTQHHRALAGITMPTTSWECPYIYLVGGIGEQGEVINSIWKGVINRLTFKPID